MYAVIEVGGKQRRVQVGEVVRVETLPGVSGDPVVFDHVLAVGDGATLRVGTPTVDGARVRGTLLDHGRGAKILTFVFKKTKNANRGRQGHRQNHTEVKIEAIEV